MNVLSIGDSTVERTAITEVMWSSQYEAAATCSAFSRQLCFVSCERKPKNSLVISFLGHRTASFGRHFE